MRALRILLLWGAPAFAGAIQAQQLLTTECLRKEGVRQLHLQGVFTDADSVLVQVYHDSDVLLEEVQYNGWSLTLGSFHSYTVKFTDAQQRVKRLYIQELSDDQVELVQGIEVDFSVVGNLALLKERDRQPDFLLFNVGTSRKR
jgi:hypothetical protein